MAERRSTLKAVAARAGVHISTASRALNPRTRHLIGEAVAARVCAVAEALDYHPNMMARGLRTQRSQGIGVVVPDITNPIFPPILRGIEETLAPYGYVPITVNTDGGAASNAGRIALLRRYGVDGLILANPDIQGSGLEAAFAGEVPVVVVNRAVAQAGVISVSNDDQDGIRQAVDHLLALGHRRLGHIAGPDAVSTGRARTRAFHARCIEAGLAEGDTVIVEASAYTEAEGLRCARLLLAPGQRPTALVCANDRLALGALTALAEAGLRCPADLSVTGFNDMPMMDRLDLPLTTVAIQQFEAGAAAAGLLLAKLGAVAAPAPVDSVTLPVRLVVRASTAPPRRGR